MREITEVATTNKRTNEKTHTRSVRGNGERRRAEIVRAAVRLFAESGFRGTTTKDIAVAAGISEASLFQYFKTKSGLYRAILEEKAQQIYENGWLDELNEFARRGADEKFLREIALKIVEHGKRDPYFLRLMLYAALERHEHAPPFRGRFVQPIFEHLRDYIEARQRAGFFRACSAEAAAFAFIGALIFYAMSKTIFQSRMLAASEDEAINNFVRLALDGLRGDDCATRKSSDLFLRTKFE